MKNKKRLIKVENIRSDALQKEFIPMKNNKYSPMATICVYLEGKNLSVKIEDSMTAWHEMLDSIHSNKKTPQLVQKLRSANYKIQRKVFKYKGKNITREQLRDEMVANSMIMFLMQPEHPKCRELEIQRDLLYSILNSHNILADYHISSNPYQLALNELKHENAGMSYKIMFGNTGKGIFRGNYRSYWKKYNKFLVNSLKKVISVGGKTGGRVNKELKERLNAEMEAREKARDEAIFK